MEILTSSKNVLNFSSKFVDAASCVFMLLQTLKQLRSQAFLYFFFLLPFVFSRCCWFCLKFNEKRFSRPRRRLCCSTFFTIFSRPLRWHETSKFISNKTEICIEVSKNSTHWISKRPRYVSQQQNILRIRCHDMDMTGYDAQYSFDTRKLSRKWCRNRPLCAKEFNIQRISAKSTL